MGMTQVISAIYQNGVFHPVEPLTDLPEHSTVRLTVECDVASAPIRAMGAQAGSVLYIAPDFDADISEQFGIAGKSPHM